MKKNRIIAIILSFAILTGCSGVGVKTHSDKSVTLTGEEYEEYIKNKEKIDNIEKLTESIKNDFLFDIDDEKLEAGIYKGLFSSLDDPYSAYYTSSEFEKLMEDSAGEFGGIGVVVSAFKSEYIKVISPIKDTPGERAGILPGDIILKVDGEMYFGIDMDKAVDHMRGEPNTDVTITIRRENEDGSYEDKDITITREIIKIESVIHEMMEDGIGYINITSFDEHTAEDFEAALNEMHSKNAKGIVLDLRNNPGGLLSSVTRIADQLLPKGVIVYTVDKMGRREEELSGKSMDSIPMTVLVNKGSASASEILSGALKDYDRAKIIGTQTFGKGIVQRIYPFGSGGYKLTISEYYTPNDTKIHGVGVEPDIKVDMPQSDTNIGPENLKEDIQLQKAIEVLKSEL